MADLTAYQLQLTSPFHSSGQGVGIEQTDATVRSDTLFSALLVAIRAVHGVEWLAELLDCVRRDPPFVVSSAFPWAGAVRFLPRPQAVPRYSDDALAPEVARRVASVPWVSVGVIEHLLTGTLPAPDDVATDPQHGVWYLRSEAAGLPATRPRWWASDRVPRVTVDRQTNRSAVYRCGRVWYGAESGLWFLVDWRDREWEPFFDEALEYLAVSGLGGERSSGHGQFRVISRELARLPEPPEADGLLTLSLYHPTSAEVQAGVLAPPAAYDLELRQGWVTSPEARTMWRKAVRMIVEGSVVRRVGPLLGDLVDVTPDGPAPHPVYRAGFALGLGVRWKGGES